MVLSVDVMDGCIALVMKRSPTKEGDQDTRSCISGQENKRKHTAHKCVIYW